MKTGKKTKIIRTCIALVFVLLCYGVYEAHQFYTVRLYNVVGFDVLPGTRESRVVYLLGEPDRRESVETTLIRYAYNLYYDYPNLMFGISSTIGIVDFFVIYDDAFQLSGRDRLRVGSSRRQVERAIRRPTSSWLTQNFRIWRTEHFIDVEIDKWVIVRFYFDENDVVNRIRISGMG